MLISTKTLLSKAREEGYAVGAFNVYNLEGAQAVIETAEKMRSPVMLQILPSALQLFAKPLVALCLEMAETATVPVAVHLDHCPKKEMLNFAVDCGFSSVMADGSDLDYPDNIRFTQEIVSQAHQRNCQVEAELGKLSGAEDGLAVDERYAKMTNPEQALEFTEQTGIDALAVCIGNVHGKYHRPPELDFERLASIAAKVSLPLVLHGTSGLPDEMVSKSIALGICKFNVNTEVRTAYLDAVRAQMTRPEKTELVDLIQASIAAMKEPISKKIQLFCSDNKA